MAPKSNSKLAAAPVEAVHSDDDEESSEVPVTRSPSPAYNSIDWTPNKLLGLYAADAGTLDTVDFDGRSSTVFSLITYNCIGQRTLIQAWNTYAVPCADYFK